MDEDIRPHYTSFVNETGIQVKVDYDTVSHSVKPNSAVNVQWHNSGGERTPNPPQIRVTGVEFDPPLDSTIPLQDAYGNTVIAITLFSGDHGYSFRALSARMLMESLEDNLRKTKRLVEEILLRMKELNLNKVRIWRHQCKHLLLKFQLTVRMVMERLSTMVEERAIHKIGYAWQNPHTLKFLCSKLISSLLEGEALLLFCGNFHNRAAFALSSPFLTCPSRFALVLRELDWTVDFFVAFEKFYVHGYIPFDDWEWCDGVMESSESDGHLQADDREALQLSLKKKTRNHFWSRNDSREKLEEIWRKRLDGCNFPACLWIDHLDFKDVEHLAGGGSSRVVVHKSKWLGEPMTVSMFSDVDEEFLVGEAILLAKVQHPNVVELMGCGFKDARGFLVTELMEQDLESLICQRSHGHRPPFELPVAIDIALQIVEAMIHFRECRVIHRDLKPSNCLTSPKYVQKFSHVPVYYTVKLTGFGTVKSQDYNFSCYMAPELAVEEPATWSADVYSFGMTCYRIFTGRDPCTELAAVQGSSQRPLIPPECPTDVKVLIERCWRQRPGDRPSFHDICKVLWRCKVDAFLLLPGDAHNLDMGLLVTERDKLLTEFKCLLSELSREPILAPASGLETLQAIVAKLAGNAYHSDRCIDVYQTIRGSLCDGALQDLDRSYLDDVTQEGVDGIEPQNSITKWSQQLEFMVTVQYAGEVELASQVFKPLGRELWVRVVGDLAGPVTNSFMQFGESVATSKRSPEKLCSLLMMYETMKKCEHHVLQVFDGQFYGGIRTRYRELLEQMAITIGTTFWEFEDWANEQKGGVSPDGTVMHLCTWVIDWLNYLLVVHRKTLSSVLCIAQSSEGEGAQERVLAKGIAFILHALERRVDAWAKEFLDDDLRGIFLMNNLYHIQYAFLDPQEIIWVPNLGTNVPKSLATLPTPPHHQQRSPPTSGNCSQQKQGIPNHKDK